MVNTSTHRESSTLDKDGHVADWFGRVIFQTAEAFGIKLTEARIRIYAADLGDLEPQQVVEAFRRCRKEGSGFFPSIPELRRQVVATPDDRALLAWGAMERAATEIGAYQSIEFEDHVAATALLLVFGSWAGWCQQEAGPDLLVKRQQFLASYRHIRRLSPDSTPPVRLAGLSEASGDYQRQPRLAAGRITAQGLVHSATEALLGQLTTKQLPPAAKE